MRKGIFMAVFAATSLAATAQTTAPQGMDAMMQNALKEVQEAKPKFGIKAGYNIARIYGKAADFSPNAKNGFTVAAFYSAGPRTGLGYRTEIVFSRQGFAFTDDGKTTAVTNDYVYMPHFTTFGIGRFFQVQVGGQLGYLLKSSKDAKGDAKPENITSFASRLDYGAAAGVEIYPAKHLILGGRYNISFGNAYKQLSKTSATPSPFPLPFNPDEAKGKNAVINFFVGFRF